jgi:hypothetical protein
MRVGKFVFELGAQANRLDVGLYVEKGLEPSRSRVVIPLPE